MRGRVLESARDLAASFSGLEVNAVCADYSVHFELPVDDGGRERAVFVSVSSIGNFDPADAERFSFLEGESIHTENSYKFTIDGFQGLARAAGFVPERVWTDRDRLFSVHCLRFEPFASSHSQSPTAMVAFSTNIGYR